MKVLVIGTGDKGDGAGLGTVIAPSWIRKI
jgi:hypothetical protein